MTSRAKMAATKNKTAKTDGVQGYLPDVYQGFYQRYPEISKAIGTLAKTCQAAGPLDKRTCELIKLGLAIGINSEGGVRSHARRAIEEGISPDEILHVVLLGFTTIGFPHTIAAYKWVEEVLAKGQVLEGSRGKREELHSKL